MFGKSAALYNAIYKWKDYAKEAARVVDLVATHGRSGGKRLLDVACGTGAHLPYLAAAGYDVQGVDVNPEMLAAARARLPGVPFREADMVRLDLDETFDAIVCLFSSIGYVKTDANLRATVAGFARHLAPGGVALVEPWFERDVYRAGTVHALLVDEPELKVCRMNVSSVDGDLSVMDMHHLVGTPDGVEHFVERHELAMFRREQFADAAAAAGLAHAWEPDGLMPDRGLHVFTKPAA
jgi:SAM-dependent methyltransferase